MPPPARLAPSGAPGGLFTPSCKGCESVFSTEIQGVFQIGDRTVSLHARVKATRTVSPPRPFTSASLPPVCIAPALVNLFFLTLVFYIFFGQNRPGGKGKAPTKLPFLPIFCPRKISSFFHFLAKTRNRKNRRKSSKNVRKVQKQKKQSANAAKNRKAVRKRRKKRHRPKKARNDRKKAQGRAKKNTERQSPPLR